MVYIHTTFYAAEGGEKTPAPHSRRANNAGAVENANKQTPKFCHIKKISALLTHERESEKGFQIFISGRDRLRGLGGGVAKLISTMVFVSASYNMCEIYLHVQRTL